MKKNELCKEPEELKCEGEGIVSGCGCFGRDCNHGKNGKRKTGKRG